MLAENLILRRAELDDYYKGLITLLSQLTSTGQITFQEFSDRFTQIHDVKNHYVYVIEDTINHIIIAAGTLLIEYKFIHGCGQVGHIEDIIVDKNQRGKGLGKHMIEYLTSLAHNEGCYKVILDCENPTVEFYRKLGYEEKSVHMVRYFR